MKHKLLFLFLLLWGVAGCKPAPDSSISTVTVEVNGEGFDMGLGGGGTFMMGGTREQGNDPEDNEKPPHEEKVDSFYMGKYEVTQRLWNAVLGKGFNHSYNQGCDSCPVEHVSWKDAQAFVAKLSILTQMPFRLPTDTEWEYAARGGNLSKGYKYSGSNDIDEVAWYIGNHREDPHGTTGTTHPVGMKKPNELYLYDMSGNAWEWVSDWFAPYSSAPQTNPTGPRSGKAHIIRGGAATYPMNLEKFFRIKQRLVSAVDYGYGVRLALSAE